LRHHRQKKWKRRVKVIPDVSDKTGKVITKTGRNKGYDLRQQKGRRDSSLLEGVEKKMSRQAEGSVELINYVTRGAFKKKKKLTK